MLTTYVVNRTILQQVISNLAQDKIQTQFDSTKKNNGQLQANYFYTEKSFEEKG